MPDKLPITKLQWSRWTWRDSSWWLGVFGAIFAVVVFVLPDVSQHSLWIRVSICAGCFVFSSVLLLLAEYLFKAASITIGRLRAYERLYEIALQQTQQIGWAQETILELMQELTISRRFEIEKTQYYGGVLYILLKKKRGIKLEAGDRIRVIDGQDGGIMGVFVVSEVRLDGYRARADYVDPVWLGFVHLGGNAEMSAPPNTVAFLMSKDQNND